MDILKRATEISDKIIGWRRDLHQIPELGVELPQTAKYVMDRLDEMGVEYEKGVGLEYAIVAHINKGKPGKCIAFRADMDALPVKEETGLPFASKNENMHACGHDTHTAGLLGTAFLLNEIKDELKGSVKLFFQPAEELTAGAEPMVKAGVMDGVDRVIGLHGGTILPSEPVGKLYFATGSMMASVDRFQIDVIGKGAHGALPQNGVDPIVVGSQIVLAIQDIISREKDPVEPAVITIGMFNGGTSYNVIPNEVHLEGTARAVTEETRQFIAKRIETIAKSIATGFRGDIVCTYYFNSPPVVNDEQVTLELMESARKIVGDDRVALMKKPVMGGEDFSYYLEQKPGSFFVLQNGAPVDGVYYSIHHPKFSVDEDSFKDGAAVFVQHAIDFING